VRPRIASQQHSVDVKEVDCEDPGCLRVQELPPGRTVPARRGIDARGTQDLIDGGRRDRHAQLGQLAMNPPVAPERVLARQADGEPGDAADRRRSSGLAPLARVVLPRGEPAMPGQQRRGRHRKDPAQRRRGMNRMSAAYQARSPGSYRTRPACRRSTAFSCRSTSSSASFAWSPRNTRAIRPNINR
jgi:hypothetical protein